MSLLMNKQALYSSKLKHFTSFNRYNLTTNRKVNTTHLFTDMQHMYVYALKNGYAEYPTTRYSYSKTYFIPPVFITKSQTCILT